MQLPYNLSPVSVVIRNADRAHTDGTEFGARWQATPELALHGGVGLLKTEITEYSGSGLEGNELPRSPAFTGSAGVLYRNRSEEHTSELQSLMRISYAVFCLKKKKTQHNIQSPYHDVRNRTS